MSDLLLVNIQKINHPDWQNMDFVEFDEGYPISANPRQFQDGYLAAIKSNKGTVLFSYKTFGSALVASVAAIEKCAEIIQMRKGK